MFKEINKNQAKDCGMALVLIFLLLGFFTQHEINFKIALVILLLDMIAPIIFYPFAFIWLGFSHLIGTIMSKIILMILYLTLVIPMGFIRKLLGKDTLQLHKFKKGKNSVMINRKHLFVSSDIEKPY